MIKILVRPQLLFFSASYYACPVKFKLCYSDADCADGREWCKWHACCSPKIDDGGFCLPYVGAHQCKEGSRCKQDGPYTYWYAGHCKKRRHPEDYLRKILLGGH